MSVRKWAFNTALSAGTVAGVVLGLHLNPQVQAQVTRVAILPQSTQDPSNTSEENTGSDMPTTATSSTAIPSNPNNPEEKVWYTPWEVIREPTYTEYGIRRRYRCVAKAGAIFYYPEEERIPKLTGPTAPSTREELTASPTREQTTPAPTKEQTTPAPTKEQTTAESRETSKPSTEPETKEETTTTQKETTETQSSASPQTTSARERHRNSHSSSFPWREEDVLPSSSSGEGPSVSASETQARDTSQAATERRSGGRGQVGGTKSRRENTPDTASQSLEKGIDPENTTMVPQETSLSPSEPMPEPKPVSQTQIDTAASRGEEGTLKAPSQKAPPAPFNAVDGLAAAALGVMAWWYVVVLLPMIRAFCWIRRKRKAMEERLRRRGR